MELVEAVGLAALFALILVKEAGLPVPIPGDLLLIGAGVLAARGEFDTLTAFAAIVVSGLLGGTVQFLLVRGAARRAILALLERLGLGRTRIDRQAERLRRGGARGVALARMTPGIRVVAIAASGLAGLAVGRFLLGLAVGNGVFAGLHFALGYLVGEPVLALAGSAAGPLAIAGVVLGVLGAAGWWLIVKRRAARAGRIRASGEAASAFAAWTDACCPACLALGGAAERIA